MRRTKGIVFASPKGVKKREREGREGEGKTRKQRKRQRPAKPQAEYF